MSVVDTINIKMLSDGKSYKIEKTKYSRLEDLVTNARDNMKSPNMIHFISHIVDPEQFKITKKDLVKLYKRALKRQFKKDATTQECPNTLVAYSIEFKNATQKVIDGEEDAYAYKVGNSIWTKTGEKLPFLHLHFYVIADCNKTHPRTFLLYSMQALNELKGLRASRYITRKQKKEDKKKYYHNLNKELDDAFNRILYLGKIEQKCSNIPYKNKFGMSKLS